MRVPRTYLQTALENLRGTTILSIDTETTGLDWSDRLFAIVIATREREYYFDTRDIPNLLQDTHFLAMFSGPKTWILKNAKFDLRMLRHAGIELLGSIVDLDILARLENNTHMSYSLADLAKRAGFPAKMDKEIKEAIRRNNYYELRTYPSGRKERVPRYDMVNIELMAAYACQDARLTYDLYDYYLKRIDPRSLEILKTELALTKVCFEMEYAGVPIDMLESNHQLIATEEIIEDKMREFKALTTLEYDNKPSTLLKVFTQAGEKLQYTEKGNPSFTDDVLETFTTPVAEVVRDIKFEMKRKSSFYLPIQDLCSDGKIHPWMWQSGTATGRFSYSEPNLQQWPKDDPLVPSIMPLRGIIKPPKGKMLVSIDYKAQEFRMALDYAGETELIEKIMAGFDPHQATADMVGITRKYAKTLNFALLYGASSKRISDMLKIGSLEAHSLIAGYFARLPRLDRLLRQVKKKAETSGCVYTWAGRKLQFDPQFAYKAPNALIQGGGADVCKKAMVELYYKHNILPLMQVHDALVFLLDEGDFDTVHTCCQVMESMYTPRNGMKLEVEVTYSLKSWAEADQIKLNHKERPC